MDSASFAKAGAIVTGIDLTPRSIELATKQFEIYGLKGEFFVADAENLPFPEESFDIVYSFGVLHHTPNIRKAIDEIYRVLKPGGQVLIMLYNKDSVFFLWDIVFLERIIHGNLLRESIEDRLSRIEYTTSGAKPLVRVYTRKEARKLFCKFRNVNVKVFQLKKDDISIPFIEKLVKQAISDKLVYSLSRHLGWNLFIRGTK
ncbi:MAG: hypothetical protein COX41_06355 [Candidatus Omnitrophica bacterium CG23_combo_of_CG06-09_8_20_14_all_41_10]|uniref:Methyltransferase type 11 domain-containing protein n=1 Tax=Candidatus Sherwoodlollariibacterium unditelluris TaxID=1974757 RepID=A0A2G9YHQ3_9BACT|nr:MAG: hypothetical protein COX41_06355 [Candidatus Omnitrophica bacterium CG23_combo_of_CG06-09_8_20_14_all_41_10]